MVGAGWGVCVQTLHPHFSLQALATPVPLAHGGPPPVLLGLSLEHTRSTRGAHATLTSSVKRRVRGKDGLRGLGGLTPPLGGRIFVLGRAGQVRSPGPKAPEAVVLSAKEPGGIQGNV